MSVMKMQLNNGKEIPPSKNRLIELDVERSLAAIFILVYHYVIESITVGYINFPSYLVQMFAFLAEIGIDLFFLLSGASLNYRWKDKWNLKNYAKSRVMAIYPDFWVSFLVLFIYSDVLHGNNATVPKWKIIFSVLGIDGYMQQFTSTFYKIGEWFLGCLLVLYFLFPLFRRFVLPNMKTILFGTVLFLLWLFCPVLFLPFNGNHTVLGQAFVFWSGILLSRFIGHKYCIMKPIPSVIILGVILLSPIPTKYKAFLCALCIVVLVGAFANALNRLPQKIRYTIFYFSRQSYRMFLIHHILLVLFVIPISVRCSFHPLLSITIYFALCIVLSVVLKYVSTPLSFALKTILDRF